MIVNEQRVVHERRKGYGAALLRGVQESTGEIVVMADADGSCYNKTAAAKVLGMRFRALRYQIKKLDIE